MRSKFFLILILALGFGLSNASAQTQLPKRVSAGIVNGKATSLPKPEYPAAALAVKASGAVKVQVLIDESGNVITASAVSGHPLLRQAAEQAARQATFKPLLLSGLPVKVTGVIVYNFTAEKNNEEKVKTLGIAVFLSMIRGSANDLNKLNQMLETDNLLKETIEEFAGFEKELAPLASLGKLAVEKRLELIDGVIASVRSRLNGANDVWQFEVGKNLGEFFGAFFQAADGDKLDLNKLNVPSFRLNLIRIKDLTYSAPPEFPADVLEKLKQFAVVDDKKQITESEDFAELWRKLETLLETISPGSTK